MIVPPEMWGGCFDDDRRPGVYCSSCFESVDLYEHIDFVRPDGRVEMKDVHWLQYSGFVEDPQHCLSSCCMVQMVEVPTTKMFSRKQLMMLRREDRPSIAQPRSVRMSDARRKEPTKQTWNVNSS